MALRGAIQGHQGDLNDLKLKIGQSDDKVWYNPNEDEEQSEQEDTKQVKQRVHIPNLSPRIIAAGGRVRITQSDGSLRMYDINIGDYVE